MSRSQLTSSYVVAARNGVLSLAAECDRLGIPEAASRLRMVEWRELNGQAA